MRKYTNVLYIKFIVWTSFFKKRLNKVYTRIKRVCDKYFIISLMLGYDGDVSLQFHLQKLKNNVKQCVSITDHL